MSKVRSQTMRIGYLDCFSGVSGDMWVGALVDAGVPIAELAEIVRSLQLPGVAVRSEPVLRAGLAGTRFVVELHGREAGRALADGAPAAPRAGGTRRPGELALRAIPAIPLQPPGKAATAHGHRGLAEITGIVQRARLTTEVERRCLEVFTAIAEVEARAHATTVEAVHFHEVGAEDTIVDVVCACAGTALLGVQRLFSSAVEVGTGTVATAHGLLPVPAPATAALLAGLPVRQSGVTGERTTPTGAALLRVLVDEFEPSFTWMPGARGYGAGTRDDPRMPNLLRLSVGELRRPGSVELIEELSCQLDTVTGEHVAWLIDEALRRGAVDAFALPAQMKKGRPGWLLTVLAPVASADDVATWMLEDSSSLGVRRHRVDRAVLERWQETRATSLGEVRFKVCRLPSGAVVARPEDDEVRRLCSERSMARSDVLRRLQQP